MNLLSNDDFKNCKDFISNKKFDKIFVITGYNSFYKSGADKFLKKIIDIKKTYIFFKKKTLPDIIELKYLIKELRKFKPDLIIALGGGCALDYAKIANVFYNEENIEKKIKKSEYLFKNKLSTLIAIPTTAGSGAEVTPFAVLYINNIKYSIEHRLVKPDYFFIAPQSLISIKSNRRSIQFSKQSLELSLENYNNYIHKPTKDNVFKMSLAANLAGKAISIAKTNAPHALSYPFSTLYNVSHGHAVSLTINQFMVLGYLNSEKSTAPFDLRKRFYEIFKTLKVKNIYEFDLLLKNLKRAGSLEGDYHKLGINMSQDYGKIMSGVNAQRLNNFPIKISKKDVKSILLTDE